MRLRVVVETYIPVEDLSHYEASSIEEAAENQLLWLTSGSIGIGELLDGCVTHVSITGEEESCTS